MEGGKHIYNDGPELRLGVFERIELPRLVVAVSVFDRDREGVDGVPTNAIHAGGSLGGEDRGRRGRLSKLRDEETLGDSIHTVVLHEVLERGTIDVGGASEFLEDPLELGTNLLLVLRPIGIINDVLYAPGDALEG